MLIIRDIPQGSNEWHELRRGVFTASHAQAIANNGKGLNTYIDEVMLNYYLKEPKQCFISEDMQRGIDLEPDARYCYEMETKKSVEEVTFIFLDKDKHVGCSPDGLVIGEKRGVELKCPKPENHHQILQGVENIPSKWIWQIQMSLYITKFPFWDFGSYCPEHQKHFITYTIEPDEEKQKMIDDVIPICIKRKLEIIEKIENKKVSLCA